MHTIPITEPVSNLSVNQVFSITLSEPPCSNCTWQITIPSNTILVDKIVSKTTNPSSTAWHFSIHTPGTYHFSFAYRKQCCGKPTLKQESFTISIS